MHRKNSSKGMSRRRGWTPPHSRRLNWFMLSDLKRKTKSFQKSPWVKSILRSAAALAVWLVKKNFCFKVWVLKTSDCFFSVCASLFPPSCFSFLSSCLPSLATSFLLFPSLSHFLLLYVFLSIHVWKYQTFLVNCKLLFFYKMEPIKTFLF